MSCRSSIILEIKECFPPDFAFPLHKWHFLSESEGFSQSPPQLQLPSASEGGLAVSADSISRDARLCWKKPPSRTSRTPPSDAPSRASKGRRLLQKLLLPQKRACCAGALPEGTAQSWIRVLVSQYPSATPGILKCGGCSAWQQLGKKWGTAAQVFHKTIWRKSTKNRSEQASCISAKLSIKKLVSMQCLICHKNCCKQHLIRKLFISENASLDTMNSLHLVGVHWYRTVALWPVAHLKKVIHGFPNELVFYGAVQIKSCGEHMKYLY